MNIKNKQLLCGILLVWVLIFVNIFSNDVIAQDSAKIDFLDEDFQKSIDELELKGEFNEEIKENLLDNSLSPEQKIKVIETINSDKKEFWEDWKNLDQQAKRNLLKGLDQEQKDVFWSKYAQAYGLPKDIFKGLDLGFGKNNIIGNSRIFFKIENLDGIFDVSHEVKNGIDITTFVKEDGSIKIIGDGYINPKTGRYYGLKVNDKGVRVSDPSAPSNGVWGGRGDVTIDVSGEKTKITLDFNRDSDGIADVTKFAQFTTSGEITYSVFQQKSGKLDEKGNDIYDRNPAQVTFNKEGKMKHLDSVYIKGADVGGFFGKDVDVYNSMEEFDGLSERKKQGSYLVIDKEEGWVSGNLKREEEVLIGDSFFGNLNDKISNADKAINARYWLLKAGSFYEGLPLVGNDAKSFVSKINSGSAILKTFIKNLDTSVLKEFPPNEGELIPDYIDRLTRENVAKSIRFGSDNIVIKSLINSENFLVRTIASPLGIDTIKNTLGYAQKFTTAAENLVSSQVPAGGTRMDLYLNNEIARKIKNVDLKAGTLRIEDNNGKFVEVVREATSFNYMVNPDFNSKNKNGKRPSFKGINFNLLNSNHPEQQVQVYSKNGRLEIIGVGKNKLETVSYRRYDALATVSIRGRVFGIISKDIKVRKPIISINFKSENAQESKDYLKESEIEFKNLKYELKNDGGFSSEDVKTLNNLANNMENNYHKILSQGDYQLDLNFLEPELSRKVGVELADALDAVVFQDPNIKLISRELPRLLDGEFRGYLLERGITSVPKLKSVTMNNIGELSKFFREGSGNSINIIKDTKNNLLQIKYGSRTFTVDSAIAPFIGDLLPTIVGSGGVNKNGDFYIEKDIWGKNRFSGTKTYTAYAGKGYRILGPYGVIRKGKEGVINDMVKRLEPKVIKNIITPR